MNGTVERTPSRLRRFGPVRLASESLTWRSAAYLLLHFPLGLVYFIGLAVLLSVSAATAIIWVGVLGLALTMILWRGAAILERRLVRVAFGVEMSSPYRALPTGANLFQKWKAMAVDPATWKDLVYLLLAFPLGTAEFAMSVVLWAASLALITMPVTIIWQQAGFMYITVGNHEIWFDNPVTILPAVPLGLALAAAVPGGGLAGLADRAAGIDGILTVNSPPGGPTVVRADLPAVW